MMRQLGVDLSHWQGEDGLSGAKWDKLVECDVRWAILKATQGTGHIDGAFATNLRRARKRGVEVGVATEPVTQGRMKFGKDPTCSKPPSPQPGGAA